jgi:hypothetical protein
MNITNGRILWRRWVAANALGELFGLGLTFAVGALLMTRLENQQGAGFILLSFVVAVASGVIEATIVGLAQWWAMHPWFPAISRPVWWLATLVGAEIAYVLGYLPSTLMSLGEQASSAPVAEPPQWIVLLLAAGMGAVGGAVLSFAQWLALRRHAVHAGRWIPANMLAWLVGMPLIFWGIDAIQKLSSQLLTFLLFAGVLLLTGAVVGAIHGSFLVRIAAMNSKKPSD